MDTSELPYQEEGVPEKKSNKKIWAIVLIAVLGLLLVCLVVAGILLWPRLFGGADPNISHVPADAPMYASIDLLKLQSEEFDQLMEVFQDMADSDESFRDALDEELDYYDLNIEDDIVPWVGQYASFAFGDIDIYDEEADFALLVESRNSGKADDFIEKLVEVIEDEDDRRFDTEENDGVTYYISEPEYDWGQDIVIARDGNIVYFGNSQRWIEDCIDVKSKDSLGSDDNYKTVVAGLPSDRLGSFYISGEVITDSYKDLADEMYFYDTQYFEGLEDMGLAGLGFSVSIPGDGLRIDYNAAYLEDEMPDYIAESLDAKYNDPKTADMVSEDVIFFVGQNVTRKDKVDFKDSPYYTGDIEESLDMFEDEFGIDVPELLDLMTGEFGFAIGPARDGLISDLADTDVGGMLILGVEDEDKMIDITEDLSDLFIDELFWNAQVDEDDMTFGDYEMVEITVDDGYDNASFITYGTGNGYFILGIGNDLIEDGLDGDSLADSVAYKDTWKNFPSGSVPTLFLDVNGMVDLLEEADPYFFDYGPDFSAFKYVAAATHQPTKTSVGGTLYIIIDF